MQQALLLIDLQQDFLDRPGLLPTVEQIEAPICELINHARRLGLPVIHVRTEVDADTDNRMPHWKASDTWECVAGTAGARAPQAFAEVAGETVVKKQYFSGFGSADLDQCLRARAIEEVWIAGVYTHGCVRTTAMDAYERGYRVVIVEDAIASTDPLHASATLEYLSGRVARLLPSSALVNRQEEKWQHFNPARPAQLVCAPVAASDSCIESAIAQAGAAGKDWCATTTEYRCALLQSFSKLLVQALPALENMLASDIGKPRRAASAELQRALGHINEACGLETRRSIDRDVTVYYRPLGSVALVTPWNNPVAIPLGKIAAALLLGNSIVWKPASECSRLSIFLLRMLQEAGLPEGLLQLIEGGPQQVARLVTNPGIAAVSLTGSEQAGRAVSALCQRAHKPLQAELGGNNAVLVLADANLELIAGSLAHLAFDYAGQRCTAIRRIIVEQVVVERFCELFLKAVSELQIVDPDDPACDVGPVISAVALERVDAAVQSALLGGAKLLCGGGPACEPEIGHYYQPTVLTSLAPTSTMVQEELFGPVVLVQMATDFEHGLNLVNNVRQGLVAGIATACEQRRAEFSEQVQAGILIDGTGLPIHPAAPFGGVKASQLGPPEHGIWDREFFSTPQVHYW